MLPGVTTLRAPLTRTLGPKTGRALEASLGLRTVGDLLRHYPRRYYTRGELTDLSSLREGDHVTVLARVDHVSLYKMPNRNFRARGEVIITDDRAKLMLTFFFRTTRAEYGFQKGLVPGMVGMFAGTVSSFRGRLQLVHPEYELLPGAPPNADLTPELAAEFATELIPVYPATAKVSSWVIGKSVLTVLEPLDAGPDPLPAELRERYGCTAGPRPSGPSTGRWTGPTGTGPASGSSGTKPSCCRPRWPSGGWPPPPCRPCRGRTPTAASPTSSTPLCRSR